MSDTASGHGIVVGVDGSDHSIGALRFAAEEARLRGVRLTLVSAYPMSPYAINAASFGQPTVDEDALRKEYTTMLQKALRSVEQAPEDVRLAVERGDATAVLLEYSRDAEAIVVGSRGRGGFTGLVLGSTSAGLPSGSEAPVTVIPSSYTQAVVEGSDHPRDAGAPISVGVDGSQHSLVAALEAARLAEERGVTLRLVDALAPAASDLSWTPLPEQQAAMVKESEERLTDDAGWLAQHYPKVALEPLVREGSAAEVMVDESRQAQLTVVGSRGRGGVVGMLLGSTSNAVLHHAEGPLVIVPRNEDPRAADHPRLAGQ